MSVSAFSIGLALFLTIDPLGILPAVVALMKGIPPRRQIVIIIREGIIALALMVIFAYFGNYLLSVLNISEYAVGVGGGLILLLIAIRLIFPHPHYDADKEPHAKEPLIVPIATPLIAGGAVLATCMMYGLYTDSPLQLGASIAIAWLISLGILLTAPFIHRVFSESMLSAIERLMGLILVLISCQMIMDGWMHFVQEKVAFG